MAELQYIGGKLLLRTDYADLDKCKSIVGGKWNKTAKAWEYPELAGPTILKVFNNVKMDEPLRKKISTMVQQYQFVEKLKKGEIEPRSHPFLMRHQRLCREIASMFDRYAFFLDTGTGKTLTSLQIIRDNLQIKWVVICPKSIIKTAWIEDHKQWFPELMILPLSKNVRREELFDVAKKWGVQVKQSDSLKTLFDKLIPFTQVFIINPESFKKATKLLLDNGVTGLIFDESAKIKDSSSEITKATIEFAKRMKKVYILSGKPAPNTPLEYFPQMKVVDEGVFGESFYSFRNMFFEPYGYMGYEWRLRDDRKEFFGKRLNLKSIFIDKDDCLDLPDKTYLVRSIELTGDALKYYKQMEKERLLEIGDSLTVANNILTSLMKLRQITSGFVIDSDITTQCLHRQKLDELLEVLEEIGDKPVIIWCNFKNEIQTIENELKKLGKSVVTAYSETKDVDVSVVEFKKGEAQYMIAHPQTLKYGVTFTQCTYAVYYSLSYSYDDYYQSHDRIYRKGQTKPCTFIFLLCHDTIDELIYEALHDKRDLADAIKEYAKGVRQD